MNVQSHLFVLAYLPAVLILWRTAGRWAGRTAAQALLLCARTRPKFIGGSRAAYE